jgi:alanine racemase
MDALMVDVTDIPVVSAGDTATLIGRDGDEEITVPELAAIVETTPHEILTGLGQRVRRVYLDKAD